MNEQFIVIRTPRWKPGFKGRDSFKCYEEHINDEGETVVHALIASSKTHPRTGEVSYKYKYLEIKNGQLTLHPTRDKKVIEWAKKSKQNIANGGTSFFIFDPMTEERRKLEAKRLTQEVYKYLFTEASDSSVISYAMSRGINTQMFGPNTIGKISDENMDYVKNKILDNFESLKDEKLRQNFINDLTNPDNKISGLIMDAMENGVLIPIGTRIHWGPQAQGDDASMIIEAGGLNKQEIRFQLLRYLKLDQNAHQLKRLEDSVKNPLVKGEPKNQSGMTPAEVAVVDEKPSTAKKPGAKKPAEDSEEIVVPAK